MNALEKFLPNNAGERRTLADMIFDKIDAADGTQNAAPTPKVYRGKSTLSLVYNLISNAI